MKCPKCGYLGFEHVERCRNCGYDFSLSPPPNLPELRIRRDEPYEGSPLDDLALVDAVALTMPESAPRPDTAGADGAARAAWSSSQTGARRELPLFGDPMPDDVPLIVKASPPRTPLAVRRATPEVPRLRADQPRASALDLAPDSGQEQTAPSPGARAHRGAWPERDPHVGPQPAALSARVAAVAIDLIVLAAIDALVVYFTAQICGLTARDLDVLPRAPLLAFLLVQNGGYLVAFTAGGQTLGKMAAGIKVVPTHADASLDLGRALVRTLVWTALAVPAGLGFLTALFGHDRRGLHDLCAGTRVVRVSPG
jgi:uncharacterized RDD family membrane protein YckC